MQVRWSPCHALGQMCTDLGSASLAASQAASPWCSHTLMIHVAVLL
jgi:hypothetical protein